MSPASINNIIPAAADTEPGHSQPTRLTKNSLPAAFEGPRHESQSPQLPSMAAPGFGQFPSNGTKHGLPVDEAPPATKKPRLENNSNQPFLETALKAKKTELGSQYHQRAYKASFMTAGTMDDLVLPAEKLGASFPDDKLASAIHQVPVVDTMAIGAPSIFIPGFVIPVRGDTSGELDKFAAKVFIRLDKGGTWFLFESNTDSRKAALAFHRWGLGRTLLGVRLQEDSFIYSDGGAMQEPWYAEPEEFPMPMGSGVVSQGLEQSLEETHHIVVSLNLEQTERPLKYLKDLWRHMRSKSEYVASHVRWLKYGKKTCANFFNGSPDGIQAASFCLENCFPDGWDTLEGDLGCDDFQYIAGHEANSGSA